MLRDVFLTSITVSCYYGVLKLLQCAKLMHVLFQDFVSAFLGEHLLLTISALRGKYEGCSDIIRTGQQVRE